MFGDANIKALKSQGCDVSLIQKSDSAATGTAMITVDGHGSFPTICFF